MKILIISDYNAPYGGNFVKSLKSLQILCNKNEDKMYFLFPERTKNKVWMDELKDEHEKNIFYFKDDSFFECYKELDKIVKRNDINLLYCHFCRHKIQMSIKVYSILSNKVRLVSHFHNHCKDSNNIIKKCIIQLGYWFYKGDINIGCSKSVMESMPYNKHKCFYVNNGIDFDRLTEYRNISLKNKENDKIILMFGFDYYRKGIDIAIKAIKQLNNPNIILAISLASNQEKVENYIINEFGEIPMFVKFLKPVDDIASYYKAADIFLSAAREEGFCYSLVEAAYCNTKIISSNIQGVPKEIPGEIIFENSNSNDLACKICEALNKSIDESAKLYVKNNYGIENWSKGVYKILKEMK